MNDLGITKEELLELAAQKLADQLAGFEDLESRASREITSRVDALFKSRIEKIITDTLTSQTEAILSKEYQPVDMWGERVGKPVTLRDQIAARARSFWDEKVDEHGKPSSWGGKPRHEYVYGQTCKELFEKAIQANVGTIVAQFKAAITDDAIKITKEHISRLIK